MSSVNLTKRGQTVSLAKTAGGTPIRVNLNWTEPAASGLFKRKQALDFDLGCLYELSDGSKGVVQALGNNFGSTAAAPWVALDGDDRSGAVSNGENLLVAADAADRIKRLAVFAYIYEGAKNWSGADAVVTVHPPVGDPIVIRLDAAQDGQGMCGICLINGGAVGYSVERLVDYVPGHRELDLALGWGLNWVNASK
jgi:tellurite resistance protein TerA